MPRSGRITRAVVAAVVAALVVGAAATPARAGDPTRVWKTIESEHFVIHYYEPLGDVGHRVAMVAERSHRVLAPALGHAPSEKTQVVLLDDTDGANGFANVLPRNAITLFVTAPSGDSVLNDHDDWLYGLVAHEYTHVLHLDTISGLPTLINAVFGKTWAPNQIEPRWIIEGIATYEESKRSSGGRTRSAIFDMFLRVPVLAGEQLDLDQVTGGPQQFPRGNAAYLYGSRFLEYIFDRHGDDTVRELSHRTGGSTLPYALNRHITDVVGTPFTELYDQWMVHLQARAALQLEAVERRGRIEGRRLTVSAESNLAPRYTADGRDLVWLQIDGISRARLRAMPVGGNVADARDLMVIDRIGAWDLMPDGSLVYEQNQTYRVEYSFQDLFHWDRKSGRTVRLTTGVRARDPAVSPDGRQVAFSMNGASQSKLAVMPLEPDAPPRVLWQGARYDQAFTPTWSPDGGRIAFSAWRKGGYRDLMIVEVATGAVTELGHDRAIDGDPSWSADGAYIYFASERTGIYNVYAYELATQATWQVTNVVGGAFGPAPSPDGTRVAYSGFVVGGWDLFEVAIDRDRWLPALPFVDDRPAPTAVADDEALVSPPRPYRPLETLAPQSWKAELVVDSFGDALTVQTQGNDAVGLHSYNLGATVGLARGEVNFGASYGYSGLTPSVRVAVARNVTDRGGYRIDSVSTRFREENLAGTASISVPVNSTPSATSSLSLDYDVDWFRLLDDAYVGPDPGATVPVPPLSDLVQAGLAMRVSYASTRGYVWGLGPAEGLELSASLRLDHPALGARFKALTVNWQGRTYYRLPWAETATLMLRYAGGLRTTELNRPGAFGLGGVPDQDIAQSIIDSIRSSSTGYLRGYEPRAVAGGQFHLANLEYRQQLWEIEHGLATLPIYVKRLHVAALLDVGNAYDGPTDVADLRWAVGGALRLDAVYGYFVPGSLEVGYARGLSTGGLGETWLLLTGTL